MNCKIASMLMVGVCATVIASSAQAGFQWTAPTGVSASAGAPVATGTALPHVPAAPVAPVASENLPGSINDVAGAIPTTPDGPIANAPIYGQNAAGAPMTDDPITWNAPMKAAAQPMPAMPRAPQSVLPTQVQPIYQPAQPVYAAPVAAASTVIATPISAAPSAMIAAPAAAMPAPVGYGVYEMAEGFGTDLPLVMAIRQVVPANFSFVFDEGINLSTNVSWQGGRPWNLVLNDMLTPLGLRANINGTVVSIVPASQTGFQQVAMAGPAVTSDIIGATVTTTTSAPVMAPATTYTAPAVYEGPVFQPTPAATSGQVDLGATTTWTAPRNSTLRSILEDWSSRVGVELYWASEYDYPVKSGVSINGSFEEAVQTLLKGLNESKPRPLGRLHPNLPNGPAVLVIETRQNTM